MSRNFDALKTPLQGFLAYHSRFTPPARWITFSGVPSTLTNFPVLVKAVGWENIANGHDVHFQDTSGNELAFELDWYDDSVKSGAWWVQIPTLYSGTAIKVLYGDASITSDQSAPGTVWADYSYVYHFSGSDPFRDVRGGKTASTSIPYSVVSAMPTGQALQLAPTKAADFYYAEGININLGTFSLIAHSSDRYYFQMKTDYYSYGFSGYSGFEVYGAGLTFKPSISFPSMLCYSASFGSSADVLFNGTFLDCSSSGRQDWYRDDRHRFETSAPCVTHLDELRLSKTVKKSAAWLQYEQLQANDHLTYTTYGPEEV